MSKEKQNKKIFTENLPKKIHKGRECIDWLKTIGCKVKGIYNDIIFEVEIIDYVDRKLYLKYKDYDTFKISTGDLIRCRLGELLKYEINIYSFDESNPRRVDLRNLPIKHTGIEWNKVAKNKSEIKFSYDGIDGVFKIISYDIKTKKITFKYLEEQYNMGTCNFIKCEFGKILGKITSDFKIEIRQNLKDEKRDLVITDREIRVSKHGKSNVNEKWYKYTCNKCGWTEAWSEERNLLVGRNGCGCCKGLTVVEGINDIPTTAPWMVKYFQGGYDEAKMYTCQSNKKITPICPDCGRVKDKPISVNNIFNSKSISCSCSDKKSYPEKFMFLMLEQIKIKFEKEKIFKWCEDKRYDFYFKYNNEDYIIETHGKQHYKGGFERIKSNRNVKTLEEEQTNDKYKKELAIDNGIKEKNYIVIDCSKSELEFIKQNILDSRLGEVFDLSIIDWLKCEEFALSNLVKKICEIKRDNPYMTSKDIGNIFKVNNNTISSYLKKGSKIWDWISYDGEKERKLGIDNYIKNKKRIK